MKCQYCESTDLYEEVEGRECVVYCKPCNAPFRSRHIPITAQEAVKLRQVVNVSQKQLADYINKNIFKERHSIDRRTISAMENGRNEVAWYVAEALDMIKATK